MPSGRGRPAVRPLQAGELAGDNRPSEGYLAKAGRLTAARYQAGEILRHECGPLTSDEDVNGDQDDEPTRRGNDLW